MTFRDLEEFERKSTEKSSGIYNITPNLVQSLVIFVSFFSLTCAVMAVAAWG